MLIPERRKLWIFIRRVDISTTIKGVCGLDPNKRHNRRLRVITVIMVALLLLSVISLDDDSWIPKITMLISATWLFLFSTANME